MAFRVVVKKKGLDNLIRAISYDGTTDALSGALAETVAFHMAATVGSIPEEVKGKLGVEVADFDADTGEVVAILNYYAKAGSEGATTQSPKGASRAIFLPAEQLSAPRRSTTFSSGGEEGVFVSKLSTTGRTSIEKYLMVKAQEAISKNNETTLEFAASKARAELKQWFAENGILYNTSLGRYQASATTTLPWGGVVEGGSIVSGEF